MGKSFSKSKKIIKGKNAMKTMKLILLLMLTDMVVAQDGSILPGQKKAIMTMAQSSGNKQCNNVDSKVEVAWWYTCWLTTGSWFG